VKTFNIEKAENGYIFRTEDIDSDKEKIIICNDLSSLLSTLAKETENREVKINLGEIPF